MLSRVTLDQAVQKNYGREAARFVLDFFTAIKLPIPKCETPLSSFQPDIREYCRTYDGGYLIFLNEYACTIRITNNRRFPLVKHPRILQPIATRHAHNLRIDIYPGIANLQHRNGEYPNIEIVSNDLEKDGYSFWDHEARNCGTLPDVGATSEKYTIILDAGAVSKLRDSLRKVQKKYKCFGQQDTLFKPLRDLFNAAWPKNRKEPDNQKISSFWNMCKKMKEKGSLVAGWTESETACQYKYYSFDYEKACRQAKEVHKHCAL